MSDPFFGVRGLSFLGCGPYSFSLEKGKCLAVRGPSGIGKTQLFRAISDLIPSTGEVLVNGISKDDLAAPKWRSQVTMLPTDSVWWYEEVGAHFTSPGSLEYLKEMCTQLGLSPEIVHWQVNRLSTGEKQRLALLRSLQIRPDILLLDEPTSALDYHNTQLVEALLLKLKDKEQLTLLWVSHDSTQLSRVSDRILYMGKDKIAPLERGRGE